MKRLIFTAGLAFIFLIPALSFAADEEIVLPSGTEINVQLLTTLSSKTNDVGDVWLGKIVEPIFGKGGIVVAAGSSVDGHIAFVKTPGHVKGKGEMRLIADSITTTDQVKYNIVASLHDADGAKLKDQEGTVQGEGKDTKATAKEAGIGAAAGAGVGAIAHGGTGALYGMGIGAMAGLAHGLLKRGKDVVLPQGSELTFVLTRETTAKRVNPKSESPAK